MIKFLNTKTVLVSILAASILGGCALNKDVEKVHHEETVIIVGKLVQSYALLIIQLLAIFKLHWHHFIFFPPKSGIVTGKE